MGLPEEHVEAAVTDLAAPESGHMLLQLPKLLPPPLVLHTGPAIPRAGAPTSPHRCTWHVAPPSAGGGTAPPCRWPVGGKQLSARACCLVAGTPKRATQLATKESATTCAVVDCKGIASAHLVVLSTTVSRCVCPSAERGHGPTRSISDISGAAGPDKTAG